MITIETAGHDSTALASCLRISSRLIVELTGQHQALLEDAPGCRRGRRPSGCRRCRSPGRSPGAASAGAWLWHSRRIDLVLVLRRPALGRLHELRGDALAAELRQHAVEPGEERVGFSSKPRKKPTGRSFTRATIWRMLYRPRYRRRNDSTSRGGRKIWLYSSTISGSSSSPTTSMMASAMGVPLLVPWIGWVTAPAGTARR